jgi:hypothetical protein
MTKEINNNIEELRDRLWAILDRIEKDPRFVPQAVEMNNTAGKLIQSAKIQLEYHGLRKELPTIDFLEGAKVSQRK